MTIQCVPPLDGEPWPTLGPQVCDFIEEYLVFGPGDLRGQPARLDDEKRALIYRMYEVYPPGHPQEGRRRFKRVAISLRKGSAKTEFAAWIAACELHPDGPVRCDGWDAYGEPVGVGVTDPYIPMVAYTEEQSDELAYGALRVILGYSQLAGDFDIGLERIMRVGGDGKCVSLASAPDARDGARTTFQHFDEPLALDTPVPTPYGWQTIGAIEPGWEVFGSDGRPVTVLGLSPVHEGRPCYRVTFSDGFSVVTDGAHRWSVVDRRASHKGAQILTTEHMAAEVWINEWQSRPCARWAIPMAGALQLPEKALPIDPYLLGAWLGDGDSRNATITQGGRDLEALTATLRARGHELSECSDPEHKAPRFYVKDLRGKLRDLDLDLWANKHVPAPYLRAARGQRLDLLRGLMDTDGHVTKGGWCTFVSCSEQLALGVRALARTLGYRPTWTKSDDDRARSGIVHKVSFQASPECVPFLLARKAERCATHKATRQQFRSVVAVERVPSVPVRCLAVDSEDHLFLVGEGLVPTHNTHRFTLPRLKRAHLTMMANIPKRRLSDAWSLETTTAPAPGEGSVAEATWDYARQVAGGKRQDSRLFFYHRQARDDLKLEDDAGELNLEAVREAVLEASGPVAEWSDIDGIIEQWRDPTADRTYLERVWLNRLVRASDRAFDAQRWKALADPERVIPEGEMITLGFDGARYHDGTALVATHILTGHQWPVGIWEQPYGQVEWEVPVQEVDDAVAYAFDHWYVWRMYCDPPYWESWVATWAGRYGEKRVLEWWTRRPLPMAYALRSYANAQTAGELSHNGDPHLARHIGNACRHYLTARDDQGQPLWMIYKERQESPHKIDAAMAGTLSWEARCDALAAGVGKPKRSVYEDRGLMVV